MKKRGQHTMGLPFGMIFAIILIIVFVVVAFVAVKSFLDVGKTSQVGLFYEELQREVDDAWQSQSTQKQFVVNLPTGITTICFANLSKPATAAFSEHKELELYDIYDSNVFLLPTKEAQGLERKKIDHLNIEAITAQENPYCVGTENDLTIKKDFYDKNVVIA